MTKVRSCAGFGGMKTSGIPAAAAAAAAAEVVQRRDCGAAAAEDSEALALARGAGAAGASALYKGEPVAGTDTLGAESTLLWEKKVARAPANA